MVPRFLTLSEAKFKSDELCNREEMQSLFDPHVENITKKIHEQLNWMQANGVNRPIVSVY